MMRLSGRMRHALVMKLVVETSRDVIWVTRNEQVVGSIPTGGSRSGPVRDALDGA
jgi:hypothetical protein